MDKLKIYTQDDMRTFARAREGLEQVVEQAGLGRVAGGETIADKQDNEAILGLEASEFNQEALRNLERYAPLVKDIGQLVRSKHIEHPQIIDFGCGPAILTSLIAKELPTARMVGVDISPDMIECAEENRILFEVAERVHIIEHNALAVSKDSGIAFDLATSRNMIHRVDELADALKRMVLATKQRGGMTRIDGFRRVDDLSNEGQLAFVAAAQQRDGEKHLKEAYIRAHLNAPTLAQYQESALLVAKELDLADMKVWAGKSNNVSLYFER